MLSHDGSLAVFDAGLTCRLAPEIAQPFGYLLQALCTGNTDRVVDKLCFFSQNIDESKVDMESFRSDMHQLMLDYVDQKSMNSPDGRPINMGVMVGAMLQCMQKHKLQLRGDVALTIMTMAISESLIRQLDPDFDLVRSTVRIPAFSPSVFVSPKKILFLVFQWDQGKSVRSSIRGATPFPHVLFLVSGALLCSFPQLEASTGRPAQRVVADGEGGHQQRPPHGCGLRGEGTQAGDNTRCECQR